MKSRSLVLLLCITNLAALLYIAAPHMFQTARAADVTSHPGEEPWLNTWKNFYKEPFESFVPKTRSLKVCIADLPCTTPPAGTPEFISKAVANWLRFPQDVWEDANTKPYQVLQFIGLKPGDRVVDIVPATHNITLYWTRLFYHVVGDEGRVFPFIPSVGCRLAHVVGCEMEREFTSSSNGYGARPPYTLLGSPRWNGVDLALDMEHTGAYRNLYTLLDVAGQFAVPQQMDMVWSTGKWHQLIGDAYKIDMNDFLPRVFESMENGGTLVIADYAGNPGTGFTQVDSLHRIDKEAVKAQIVKAGWVFDSESNLWAKKDDDHSKVVPEEALPGTADMFILKFKKPMNAPPSRRPTRQEMAGWLDSNYTGSGNMDHGQKNGGGTWHNADYTGTEFQGPSGGIVKTWFMDSTGALCERQEWEPITAGIIGCHYERERVVKYKLGTVWEQRTEFATDDPNATGFRAAYPRALSPFHTFPVRPEGCYLGTACTSYNEEDNVAWGHIR